MKRQFYEESSKYAKAIKEKATLDSIPIKEIEAKMGMSSGYLSRCAKGYRRLSIDDIVLLGRLMDCNFFQELEKEDKHEQQIG